MNGIPSKKKGILLFLLLVFLVLLIRLPYTPITFLIIDEAGFAAVADKLTDGHALYREACDNKPPFVFYFYAGIFYLFGRGNMFAVHMASLLFVLGGLWFFQRLTAELFSRKLAAISTAAYALYLVASNPSDVFCASTELFMMPAILLGLYCCARGRHNHKGWRWFAGGILLGLSAWIKQTGILYCLAVPVASIVIDSPLKRSSLCLAFKRCFLAFLGFCTISLFWLGLMWRQGILRDFLDMVVFYNMRIQVASIPLNQSVQMAEQTAYFFFQSYFAVCLLALTGIVLLIRPLTAASIRRTGNSTSDLTIPNALFVLSWLAIGIASVSIGGRFYGYYMYVLAPIAAILAAIAIEFIFAYLCKRTSLTRWAFYVFLVIGCVVPFYTFQRNIWLQASSALRGTNNRYNAGLSGWISTNSLLVSQYIYAHTRSNDQVFIWGYHPGIYVLSERNFASRYFSTALQTGFVWGTIQQISGFASSFNISYPVKRTSKFHASDTAQWIYPGSQALLLKDLQQNPPELFIDGNVEGEWPIGNKYPIAGFPIFQEFLNNNYQFEKEINGYRIYRRSKKQPNPPAIAAAIQKDQQT